MLARSPWVTRANALTFFRVSAAPLLVLAIRVEAVWAAAAVFFLAVVSDFADGFVARRYGEASGLGRLIDHASDAIFVTAGTAALAYDGILPALLPTLIVVSFLQYALDSGVSESRGPRPSALGRGNGIAYYVIIAVPIVRDALNLGWPEPMVVLALGWVLVGSTLISIASRLTVSFYRR